MVYVEKLLQDKIAELEEKKTGDKDIDSGLDELITQLKTAIGKLYD